MYRVDLNCDMGESFGSYRMGNDEAILNYVTSANIACGFHAGDPGTMRKTVRLALDRGVSVGAHPGLPDLVGFGRRNMEISPQEAFELTVYQIGALSAFVKTEGGIMQHVKPHGALYNLAAKSAELSRAIAEAVYKVDPELVLFGLAGSELVKAGESIGLRTANEVFADRTYQQDGSLTPRSQQDGSLTPRSQQDALIADHDEAVRQVLRMVREGKVLSRQGVDVAIKADTVCIHGDGSHALVFARKIRESLSYAGVSVQAVVKR